MQSFNEFQRTLKKHGIEGPVAIVMTEMYDAMCDMSKQMTEQAQVTLALAESVQSFVQLHETTQGKVEQLDRAVSGRVDGVSVSSTSLRDN